MNAKLGTKERLKSENVPDLRDLRFGDGCRQTAMWTILAAASGFSTYSLFSRGQNVAGSASTILSAWAIAGVQTFLPFALDELGLRKMKFESRDNK